MSPPSTSDKKRRDLVRASGVAAGVVGLAVSAAITVTSPADSPALLAGLASALDLSLLGALLGVRHIQGFERIRTGQAGLVVTVACLAVSCATWAFSAITSFAALPQPLQLLFWIARTALPIGLLLFAIGLRKIGVVYGLPRNASLAMAGVLALGAVLPDQARLLLFCYGLYGVAIASFLLLNTPRPPRPRTARTT